MSRRILLVEPSPDLAKNLRQLLCSLEGYQVVGQSSSGLDAILQVSSLSPDVLVLELCLPDIGGLEVARWARRAFPEMRVVLLSAYDLPEYRLAAARLQTAAFVSKANLCRGLPRALDRLRLDQATRAGEHGGLHVDKWAEDLRHLADWVTERTRARDRAALWRAIHAVVLIVCLEIAALSLLQREGAAGLIAAGWVLVAACVARDFQTLATSAGSPVGNSGGENRA